MTADARSARPVAFFFLVLPFGIAFGFVTVTLPFALTRAGVSVAAAAGVVALAHVPNTWRFLWAPVTDLTLTLRRWYAIGLAACAATVILLAVAPVGGDGIGLVTILAVAATAAANMLVVPVGGMMAHGVDDDRKGRAGGWYQAGSLGGTGLGGGAGVWLASHGSMPLAGIVLAAAMLPCALALASVPAIPAIAAVGGIGDRLREIGRDFRELMRSPHARLVAVLVVCPIGVGGASALWSAVAPGWHADPDQVAFATGIGYALAAGVGCVSGGWFADRVGRWWAFFGAGALMTVAATAMAAAPRTPPAYLAGLMTYSFTQGLANAAFSALLLYAIGRGAATTKYAILGSLGNLPVAYMTATDGWAHDRFGAGGMLLTDALAGIALVAPALVALWWIRRPAPQSGVVAGATVRV